MSSIMLTVRVKGDGLLKAVPRQMIAGNEARIFSNHGRTLDELEGSDGFHGLFPEDILAIIEDRPYSRMAASEASSKLLAAVANFQNKSPAISNMVSEALVSVETIRNFRPAPAIRYELNRIENRLNIVKDLVK